MNLLPYIAAAILSAFVAWLVLTFFSHENEDKTMTYRLGFGWCFNYGTVESRMVTRRAILYRKATPTRQNKLGLLFGWSFLSGERKTFLRSDLFGGFRWSYATKARRAVEACAAEKCAAS